MGVRLDRSIVIARGKNDAALKYAGDVSSYVEELTGVQVIWGLEVGGTVGKIHFYADYENFAALETALGLLMSDAGYGENVATNADLFVGAPEDTWVYTM